jgi:hypothetical protein
MPVRWTGATIATSVAYLLSSGTLHPLRLRTPWKVVVFRHLDRMLHAQCALAVFTSSLLRDYAVGNTCCALLIHVQSCQHLRYETLVCCIEPRSCCCCSFESVKLEPVNMSAAPADPSAAGVSNLQNLQNGLEPLQDDHIS